jgi:hypothetical protein
MLEYNPVTQKINTKDLSAEAIRIRAGEIGEKLSFDTHDTMRKISSLSKSIYKEPGVASLLLGAADRASQTPYYPDNFLKILRESPAELGPTTQSLLRGVTIGEIKENARALAGYVEVYTDQKRQLREYQDIQQAAHEVSRLPESERQERLEGLRLNLDCAETARTVRAQEAREAFERQLQDAPSNDWLQREVEAGRLQMQDDHALGKDRDPDR